TCPAWPARSDHGKPAGGRPWALPLVAPRSQTLFGNAPPRNSVSRPREPERLLPSAGLETEFRGRAFPNRSLGTRAPGTRDPGTRGPRSLRAAAAPERQVFLPGPPP